MNDDLIEPVAGAINTAVVDRLKSGLMFNPTACARAALEAIEAAGYVVVPRGRSGTMCPYCFGLGKVIVGDTADE